jgi:BirA family biotin operon repressor/biotin-[acetyl-CoA-carboxylase] ligase
MSGEDFFNDALDKERITRLLAEKTQARVKIAVFDRIDSTNAYARRLIADAGALADSRGLPTARGKELHLSAFVADMQSAGRGRMERRFSSPAGCGIYFSLIYAVRGNLRDSDAARNMPQNPSRWTAGAAVAVCRAVEASFAESGGQNIECGIKWVNDIFVGEKKVCGILAEGVSSVESLAAQENIQNALDAVVVGIGINVRTPPGGFPPEIRDIAGALTDKTPPACPSRNMIVAELIFRLLDVFERENFSDTLCEYKRRSIVLGKKITVLPLSGADSYRADAIDINEEANLVVRMKNGETRALDSAEVKIVR